MEETITSSQAKEKIDTQEVTILDVRTKEEYEQGHLKNSQLIPLQELEEKVEQILVDKNREIIVYCRSGVRSKQAAKILIKKGYQKVYDMGGIIDWPYEIEK